MADQFSNKQERPEDLLRGPEAKENAERSEKPGAKEIKKTSQEFIEGVSEVVEGAEAAEFAEGYVGEEIKEGKKIAPGGGAGGQAQAGVFDITQIALPKIEIMRSQVSLQIAKEIHMLEKEAAKILSSGRRNFSPFKLNGVVAKIRELKEILAGLAYATLETLKGWWLKYVKGITI